MADTTLLDVVQKLLSDMDSDTVNTISETIEATQVANVVKDCYEQIMDEHRMFGQHKLFNLEGVSDTDRPTHLRIPEGYFNLQWVKYDNRLDVADDPEFVHIQYVDPEEFITRTNMRRESDANVEKVTDFDGAYLFIANDKSPDFYTTFDNDYIVCDSYNSDVESTLMESKTQAFGQYRPDLTLSDNSVIDLPKHLMSLLMAEARETCFEYFKDGAPQKVVRNAVRTRVRAQRTDHKLNRMGGGTRDLPDYGRRPRR